MTLILIYIVVSMSIYMLIIFQFVEVNTNRVCTLDDCPFRDGNVVYLPKATIGTTSNSSRIQVFRGRGCITRVIVDLFSC